MMRVVIAGAGGHARSVIEAMHSGSALEPVACTDPDPSISGTTLDGVPVTGDDQQLTRLLEEGVKAACAGIGGTGDNAPRARLFEQLRALGFELPRVIHASAHVARNARLGAGVQILAGAIVGPGAVLGDNVIVNTGAIVEHDCEIGNHVHLATGCALGGGVRVDQQAHVGIGACVLQGLTIGPRSVVGAGAVVTRDVGADTVVVGVPASAVPGSG